MPEENKDEPNIESEQFKADAEAVNLLDEIPEPDEQPDPFKPGETVERGAQAPQKEEPPVVVEEKVEERVEDKAAKSDDDLEAELALIQPKKGDHPNIVKAIDAMKARVKEANALARSTQERIAAAEKEREEAIAQSGKLPEEIERELAELRQERRFSKIEHDPVFQKKYSEPIQRIDSETLGLLKSWNLPPDLEKFIAEQGGVSVIKYSSKLMPDGKESQATWFKREIWDNLEEFQREDIDDGLKEARRLSRERDRELATIKADAKSWEEKKRLEQQEEQKQWESRADKARDNAIKEMGIMAEELIAKPTATPEEKEFVEWHNKSLKESAKIYGQIVGNNDPEVEVPKALAAARAYYLNSLLERKEAEIAKLQDSLKQAEEKLGKYKTTTRTAKQSNAPAVTKTDATELWRKTDDQALKELDNL